ncbi:3' terminal RNA ribose 2'-O-methyltransferase Hen1 [Gordonia pseudamarae]|uniref:Small RNA 2'-O-methyltransferase n=1 Tax=Gordonia pseudamarae TaxID=2831662 RepID=A0ABX6IJY4_9ACTN|nr:MULTISPECIES: 3' terminal RNA ribose 2'-O-methyltransferase Hen1 [Gordonia]MBD0021280.1 3' terminal RNA ribose 2'-O-methyltransferase Hen1 [Gordonia sp. (in: high G+C Gram-positive bacteria)]QHN26533.1 3' terminal RNA ribose 2'-O-methyltransferase Hen1 [Gordonia pseudamarae]QHN35426.1 3' terminal RNA ribose 2'-O-methyltransferase Hen1 [Gordonia pseudamarae]
MIATIEVTGDDARPATDLGFLLHKHPDRVQTFATTQGTATVFYSEATAQRCRVVLHVDGAGVRPDKSSGVSPYVNALADEASSRFVVALGKVFGDTIAGRAVTRPDLVSHVWEVTITIAAVPLRSASSPADLFGPIGWDVGVARQPLSPVPWGDSAHGTITLRGRSTLRDALRQLAVLLPVLADDKHYFVDDDEVDKLDRLGDGWLGDHPRRGEIVRGYLKRIRPLTERAALRFGDAADPGAAAADDDRSRPYREPLARQRRNAVTELVLRSGARSVLDVGCGEGKLLAGLVSDGFAGRLAGVDVSVTELNRASARLARLREVAVWQSSLMYTDPRCRGFDAVVLMEVIEHIDTDRLAVAEYSVFDAMAPRTVVVTTPNREHNIVFGLADGELRHRDHRFEFTRDEFAGWAAGVAERYRYAVELGGVGDDDPKVGPPTQTAVFTRIDKEDKP